MTIHRKPYRLVEAPKPTPLRSLEHLDCYLHNPALRQAWADAIGWMRTRGSGSIWILDKQMGRKS